MQHLATDWKTPTGKQTMKTRTQQLKVRELNELLSCFLCKGYIINPTTVDMCLHTYCRSCMLKHLRKEPYCPQCKNNGGKQITEVNLKLDDILRTCIYKLVPGLYQKERERVFQFSAGCRNTKLESQNSEFVERDDDEDFFSPTEPISLSLEYFAPLVDKDCDIQIPPVRYLQCPASVKIYHLKRFLCSKYDIDPANNRIDIQVIYEEEVLPNDLSLMDVGYCYNWKRHAPMKFVYRILIYEDDRCNVNRAMRNHRNGKNKFSATPQRKSVSFANELIHFSQEHTHEIAVASTSAPLLQSPTSSTAISYTLNSNPIETTDMAATGKSKSKKNKNGDIYDFEKLPAAESNVTMKVVIARKSFDSKKQSSKRVASEETSYAITNDFKSLRSNDIRYSDYTVMPCVNSGVATGNKTQKSPKAAEDTLRTNAPMQKCDIVVSIPQSQIPKSPYSSDEQFENVSLAQLKNASKKSPNSPSATPETSKKLKNVPKLKIELSSLKAKLSIPKPKSADVWREEKGEKSLKHRKHSLDESTPIADILDIETYAKNIGLKPIEVPTRTDIEEPCEKSKYSPNASPMSSSSSTASSCNGNLPLTLSSEISSSFHKKRKKKHSKDSKDSSKRRKLHAEISSQPAKESLKMKVKITAPHSYKSKRSPCDNEECPEQSVSIKELSPQSNAYFSKPQTSVEKSNLLILNKTLGEESHSINNLMKNSMQDVLGKSVIPDINMTTSAKTTATTTASVSTTSAISSIIAIDSTPSITQSLIWPVIKDTELPASPPLPPSLFKTTAIAFNALTSSPISLSTNTKEITIGRKAVDVSKEKSAPASLSVHTPITDKSNPNHKTTHFAVPNPPRIYSHKLSTPTSIASAFNKHVGIQLKRSVSLDESYASASESIAKQRKLEEDSLIRKSHGSLMGSAPVPTSKFQSQHSQKNEKLPSANSMGGNSFEIPYYMPPPGTYNHDPARRKSVAPTVPTTTATIFQRNGRDLAVNTTQTTCSTNTNTIARQRSTQSQLNLLPILNKPALEIVRITSNQSSADVRHSPPLSPPKRNRLMGPPISFEKNKKPITHTPLTISSSHAAKSQAPLPNLNNNNIASYHTSPPALINLRNKLMLSPRLETTVKKSDNNKTNGSSDKTKISLRDFRPTSKDGSVDILDLSAGKVQEITTEATSGHSSVGNSLEAALNKIKQNISSSIVADKTAAKKLSNSESSNADLQNLHLLSESATAREKIAIKSQSFEKPKPQQPQLVLQQNASVRNIPNPSALAFRNQPSTLSTDASKNASISTQSVAKGTSPYLTTSEKGQLSNQVQSPSTNRSSKKPTTIDQVAANLNIRAAAAEASAIKAASVEEVVVVSSTSSVNNKSKEIIKSTAISESKDSSMLTPATRTCRPDKMSTEDNNIIAKAAIYTSTITEKSMLKSSNSKSSITSSNTTSSASSAMLTNP